MSFSEQVKYVRNALYLSQAEMATLMGVTQNTIRRWEHGATPRVSAKRKLYNLCAKKKIALPQEPLPQD